MPTRYIATAGRAVSVGWTLRKFIIFGLMSMLFIFLIINSVYIGIQEKSMVPVIKDLGERISLTTLKLEQDSLNILNSEAGIRRLPLYSALLSSIIIIIIWFKAISWIVDKVFVSKAINWFINLLLTTIFFFGIQIMFLATIAGQGIESLTIPFRAFSTFFHVLPQLTQPAADFVDRFTPETDINLSEVLT